MREHRNPTPYCHADTTTMPRTYIYVNSAARVRLGRSWATTTSGCTKMTRSPAAAPCPRPTTRAPTAATPRPVDGSRLARTPAWATAPPRTATPASTRRTIRATTQPYNPDLPALGSEPASNYYAPNSGPAPARKPGWCAAPIRRPATRTCGSYIDSQYIDGSQTYSVTITVKYFDIGTDTWSLEYDSLQRREVGRHRHQDRHQAVEEQAFNITDAKFANRLASGNADFYIDCEQRRQRVDPHGGPRQEGLDGRADADADRHGHADDDADAHAHPTATPTTGIVEGNAYWDRTAMVRIRVIRRRRRGDRPEAGRGGEVYSATSGADGEYRFGAVAPGQYLLIGEDAAAGLSAQLDAGCRPSGRQPDRRRWTLHMLWRRRLRLPRRQLRHQRSRRRRRRRLITATCRCCCARAAACNCLPLPCESQPSPPRPLSRQAGEGESSK